MLASGIAETAPAKVNLYLHVTGKRADGYHLLKSLFVYCDVGDRLEAAPSSDLTLTVSGPFAHYLSGDNLVMKAARLLKIKYQVAEGALLSLTKNLPVAAGIGGGSADAAAALRLLVRLWNLPLSGQELQSLALELGADVPACLRTAPQCVEGIGEQVSAAPAMPAMWLVLVHPAAALMTADVFREFKGPYVDTVQPTEAFVSPAALMAFLKARYNALQMPAMRLQPSIQASLDDLAAQPGCQLSRMSGSGATCFGIFEQPSLAQAALEVIQRKHPSWWVTATKVLS